jgi:hypothetical protein
MSTLLINGRIYRRLVPSDLPKVQAGKLKANFTWCSYACPATLISVKCTSEHRCDGTIWLIPANVNNLADDKHDSIVYGSHNIIVDITPAKRYAIWNHKNQRFQTSTYQHKADAEYWLNKEFPQNLNFYVVEWEIKEEV